jgi:hypothetical protein
MTLSRPDLPRIRDLHPDRRGDMAMFWVNICLGGCYLFISATTYLFPVFEGGIAALYAAMWGVAALLAFGSARVNLRMAKRERIPYWFEHIVGLEEVVVHDMEAMSTHTFRADVTSISFQDGTMHVVPVPRQPR